MTKKVLIEIKADASDYLAENKDVAKKARIEQIIPALDAGDQITIDFSAVKSITQSYANALIGEGLKKHGLPALELIEFKGCTEKVQAIIGLVVDYHLADRNGRGA